MIKIDKRSLVRTFIYRTISSITGTYVTYLYDITNIQEDLVNNASGIKTNGILINTQAEVLNFTEDLSITNFSQLLEYNKSYALLTEFVTNGQNSNQILYFRTLPESLLLTEGSFYQGDIVLNYGCNTFLLVAGSEKRAIDQVWGPDSVSNNAITLYINNKNPLLFQQHLRRLEASTPCMGTYRVPQIFNYANSLGPDYFIPDIDILKFILDKRSVISDADTSPVDHSLRWEKINEVNGSCFVASNKEEPSRVDMIQPLNIASYPFYTSMMKKDGTEKLLTLPVRFLSKE